MVAGDTRARHVEEQEVFAADTLFDQFGQMLLLAAKASRDECGTHRKSKRDGIDGVRYRRKGYSWTTPRYFALSSREPELESSHDSSNRMLPVASATVESAAP